MLPPFTAVASIHRRWALTAAAALLLQALGIKKIALLFLTTRRLAHEKLWRLWMWDAAQLVPRQALPGMQVRMACWLPEPTCLSL